MRTSRRLKNLLSREKRVVGGGSVELCSVQHPARAIAALLLASACTQTGSVPPPPPPPACTGAPTLAAIQDGVLTKSCAFGSCHSGINPAAGLDLSAGRACGALVGVASGVFSNRVRVVPGHPEK